MLDYKRMTGGEKEPPGRLLTNQGRVLLYLSTHPDARQVEMRDALNLTLRTVVRALRGLEAAGLITTVKTGRRNAYVVNADASLGHQFTVPLTVAGLVQAIRSQADTQ